MAPARMEYRATVGYEQAHLRLKNDRGPASASECFTCGDRAAEWAYMGGDPNEISEGRSVYSLDQSRYEAMCVPCHRRHDRAARDGRSIDVCPRGHLWSENTGVRIKRSHGAGLRFCKACHRENAAAYRMRQKERAA